MRTPLWQYGSFQKASHRSSLIMANWPHCSSLIMANWPHQAQIQLAVNPQDMTPGRVQYYILHSATLNSETFQHLFAYVLWYQPHPDKERLGKPLQVWYNNIYQTEGPSSFIPIQRIATSCIALPEDDRIIVCPVVSKAHM